MCDVFICSDSGVGLCEDDRKLLEGLGSTSSSSSSKSSSDKKVKFDDIQPASEPQLSDKDVDVIEVVEDGNNNKEAEEDRNRKDKENNKKDRNSQESLEKVGCAGKNLANLSSIDVDRFQSNFAISTSHCCDIESELNRRHTGH